MDARDKAIAIVGAGPLGLATALALHRHDHAVCIFDARSAGAALADDRTLALSQGSRELLEVLGAWPAQAATPIERILVSQQDGYGRTRLAARDYGLPALGYVLGANSLVRALRARVDALGIEVRHDCHVDEAHAAPACITLSLHDAATRFEHDARLLLRCDGFVPLQAARSRDYDQHALICLATPARAHEGLAHERFTARGPLALLPCGTDYAVVWTVPGDAVEGLLAASDEAWLSQLNAALGGLVELRALHARGHHPLGLRMRREVTAPRCVWLGNAAQTLHPVAGQGFNLALRDTWELAETLLGADDPGAPALLARYAARRRLDREGAAGFTDLLVRSFSNANSPLNHLRGLGLSALDCLPPLRHFVARRMIYGARAWP